MANLMKRMKHGMHALPLVTSPVTSPTPMLPRVHVNGMMRGDETKKNPVADLGSAFDFQITEEIGMM
jgi:hypothetical protein